MFAVRSQNPKEKAKLSYFKDRTLRVLLHHEIADVVLATVVLDLLQALRCVHVHVGRYSDRPQVACDAQLIFRRRSVSNRTHKCIG